MSDPLSEARDAARHGPLYVVINVASGAQDRDQRLDMLRCVFTAAGRAHHFLPVDGTVRITAVAARAVAQAREHRGVVVAAGGDGTLNAVAQVVLDSGCPFGVLPQGTFNYFGRAHGIPQDIEAAAVALLRSHVEAVQIGSVNGHVFLVNASLGLYPKLLEDREAFKQQLGRSRGVALLSALATLLRGARQLRLDIDTGDGSQSLRTPTLFVGNNRLQFERLGLDQPASALERGQLAAIAIKPIGTAAMLGLALRGALGTLGEAGQLTGFAFRKLTVRPRGYRWIKLATDGEILRLRTPLVFEVAPQPLLLLVPDAADRVEAA